MHSRLIAWLKILFPLGALVLLSTIFLYSRSNDPISVIPVLSSGVDPSQGEQVGSPFYAGATDGGHALTLSARQARALGVDQSGMQADDLQAVLDVEDGSQIVINAKIAELDESDILRLRNGVVLESTAGYTVRTEGLDAAVNQVKIESTGPVDAEGPGVVLSAGKLRIEEDGTSADLQLLFTDGVKLVYTPQKTEAE